MIWAPLKEESLSVFTGAGQHVTIYDYDDPAAPGNTSTPNQAPTTRLGAQIETGYTLDASGATVSKSYTTSFTYDTDGHLKTISGPRSQNFTEHFYDPTSGFRTSTRRYLNGSGSTYLETTYSNFDFRGNPQTVTDPNGQATLFTYDTVGRVKTATPPFSGGGSTVTFTYDIDGNLTQIDFPSDSFSPAYFLRFGYDTKNKLTFIADAIGTPNAAGNAIVYERSKPGRVTRQARYLGFVDLSNRGTIKGDATFDYDEAGRLTKSFNPVIPPGNTVFTQYVPDPNENPATTTDENGKTDNRIYDAIDRLKQISQVRGGSTYVTAFDYDTNSRLTRITDPTAKNTLYQHDDYGRLVKTNSPNTGVTLYLYDEAGNLATKKENFAGTARTTNYTYDGLDRLLSIHQPTTADWIFTYDANAALNQKGRLSSVTTGTVTTDREYFPRGDLKLERTTIGGTSYTVQYVYDATGNQTSVQAPSGLVSVYAYSGSRPKTITVNSGASQQVVRNIAFDPFGGRTRAEFPPFNSGTGLNTVISTRSYNLRGQVAALQVTSPAGTVLDRSFDYAYTAGGVGPNDPGPNLDRITDNRDGAQSRFFFYDTLDRFQSSKTLSGSSLYEYTYDAAGNRILESAGGSLTGSSYDPGTDRLATNAFAYIFGTLYSYYAHDVYGNRIWEGWGPYAGQPTITYDNQNQLTEYRYGTVSTPLGQYTYDAFGRRVRKITPSATTLYFYDSSGNLIEERNGSTGAMRNYVWLEDEPVGIIDSGTPPTFSWIHTDYLGMPIAVTNSLTAGNAQAVWRASYSPFGQAGEFPDPDGDGQPFKLALRFPGQYYDAESNYHYNGQRYYDAYNGRYVTADPIGQLGGVNLYAYTNNRPTMLVDYDGLKLRIEADWSAGRARVEGILERVRSTARGGELIAQLEADSRDHVIRVNDLGECSAAKNGDDINFDPDSVENIVTPGGIEAASPERKLAHELGHIAEPGRSDFDKNGRTHPAGNVHRNENPVAEALGQRPRVGDLPRGGSR